MATGTSQGGSRKSTGTSASCTGEVQASGSSNRAPWASEIIAMLSSNEQRIGRPRVRGDR